MLKIPAGTLGYAIAIIIYTGIIRLPIEEGVNSPHNIIHTGPSLLRKQSKNIDNMINPLQRTEFRTA